MKAKLIKDSDGYWLDISDDGITKRPLTDFGQLSIKNCEAITNGYDLDELIKDESSFMSDDTPLINKIEVEISFMRGFQKAMEILGDKKFSEEDVISMIEKSRETGLTAQFLMLTKQQTEWDVSVVMKNNRTGKIINSDFDLEWDENGLCDSSIPKLDKDGCLILKRL